MFRLLVQTMYLHILILRGIAINYARGAVIFYIILYILIFSIFIGFKKKKKKKRKKNISTGGNISAVLDSVYASWQNLYFMTELLNFVWSDGC